MEKSFDIAALIHKSFQEELTAGENQQLQQWRQESVANEELYQELLDHSRALSKMEVYQRFDTVKAWSSIQGKLEEPKVVPLYSKVWRYAAAVLLPVLMAGAIFYYFQSNQDPLAGIDEAIVPGMEQAVLILSDGSQVDLTSQEASQTIKQGAVNISNHQSKLQYEEENTEIPEPVVAYNELQTPKGGTYQLQLADGTKITLNAASSIRFPVSFTDSTRTVYLSGEAFFDVTHTGKPFIVHSETQEVRVLGTQFNVMAYSDELIVETTLVEGKVQVESADNKHLLKPGEQAVLDQNTLTVQAVNTDNYTSWMDGKFQFKNSSMEEVMKRLARWYDFSYEFENEKVKSLHFTGRIDNQQQISVILKMLEVTTAVTFEFNDEQIIIQ